MNVKAGLRVGIDFDNTIVCYDDLLGDLALARGLTPSRFHSKGEVRDYLRKIAREDAWTELQGEAYGAALKDASAFPGALEFIKRCALEKVPVTIISHKTLKPFLGPAYDLHKAARDWLKAHDDPAPAYFELTKQAKLSRIAQTRCTHFIDDLPEFLLEPGFPPNVERILFDPSGLHADAAPLRKAGSWKEIESWILG